MAGFDPAITFKFWRLTRHEIPGSGPGMILGGRPPYDHFFLPAIGFDLPLRVRAFVWVR
jgi:hypothetical protein